MRRFRFPVPLDNTRTYRQDNDLQEMVFGQELENGRRIRLEEKGKERNIRSDWKLGRSEVEEDENKTIKRREQRK